MSSSRWYIFLKLFGDIPWILVHCFQKIVNFLYVCQSASWPTSLLILDKYRDISSSGWDNFLKRYGDIPWIFLHYYQISSNFLSVCQSVSWLTSVQKLGQYRDISCSGWYIFLKLFGDIPGMFVRHFQINSTFLYVCHSIGWLTSIMKLGQYRDISYSGWDIFQKFWGDIPSIFLWYFKINSNC